MVLLFDERVAGLDPLRVEAHGAPQALFGDDYVVRAYVGGLVPLLDVEGLSVRYQCARRAG
jgi:hypothetical protein